MARQVHKVEVTTAKRTVEIPIRFEYMDGMFEADFDGHKVKGDRYNEVVEKITAFAQEIDESDSILYYKLTVADLGVTIELKAIEITEDVQGTRKGRDADLDHVTLEVTPSKTLRWTLFRDDQTWRRFVLVPVTEENRIKLVQLSEEGKTLDKRISELTDRRSSLRGKFESIEGTIWDDASEVETLLRYVRDVLSGIEKEEAESLDVAAESV